MKRIENVTIVGMGALVYYMGIFCEENGKRIM